MSPEPINAPHGTALVEPDEANLLDLLLPIATRWRLLVCAPLAVGVLALGVTFLIKPTFTSKTVFLPPQQQQSATASALAALGPLAGLAGGGGIKTAADQYVSLMQSVTIQDRLLDRFKLLELYEAKYRFQARKQLEQNTRINLGKKDGLISVEVDADAPQLAADMANQYVAELRRLTSELALTEAQQRRIFFETQLKQTRDQLMRAQRELQASGFNASALRAEPRASAEAYAKLKAQATAAEIRLQSLRSTLTDASPEVGAQLAVLNGLREQLGKLESSPIPRGELDYVSRYRDFKYQETLVELFARQFELARIDESREGALIQVVDPATAAEHKSKPKRAQIAILAFMGSLVFFILWIQARHAWQRAKSSATHAEALRRLRAAPP